MSEKAWWTQGLISAVVFGVVILIALGRFSPDPNTRLACHRDATINFCYPAETPAQ